MLNQETAKAARTDSGYILRAPRRMRVADAVAQYMRVLAWSNLIGLTLIWKLFVMVSCGLWRRALV